ncbi:YciI family protein [Pseudonocardia sp. TRM90224]|uniref:YciI family protein n=1 Tax=Pseudonocardia sp. TRM90224 TaxID=2812678 RepID=UPI001E500495|nr:YciI family protein [Pseudonocardia sp. TRM90224]
MRYLVILEGTQPATPPPAELMAGIMKLGEEATRAGVMLDNAGLAPSAAGARVTVGGGSGLQVTDGPFAESKEMISYALYDTRTKADVVEWTSRFMALHHELWPGWEGEARVLKVMGPEDFAPPS